MRSDLLAELKELPAAERLNIIGELWDSLGPNDLPPPSSELLNELEGDLAEHRADPSAAMSWAEVQEWLLSRRK